MLSPLVIVYFSSSSRTTTLISGSSVPRVLSAAWRTQSGTAACAPGVNARAARARTSLLISCRMGRRFQNYLLIVSSFHLVVKAFHLRVHGGGKRHAGHHEVPNHKNSVS